MTPLTLARFAVLILVGVGAVHAVVWGMAAMLADLGEAPVLNWSAWWTVQGIRTSVAMQLRVGVTAAMLSLGFLAAIYGASGMTRRVLVFSLAGASMLGAIVIEAVLLSSTGFGPSRAMVNGLLGSFAHNGLSIAAAMAVSHGIRFAAERRFLSARAADPSTHQPR